MKAEAVQGLCQVLAYFVSLHRLDVLLHVGPFQQLLQCLQQAHFMVSSIAEQMKLDSSRHASTSASALTQGDWAGEP